jgi:hypothetical protein
MLAVLIHDLLVVFETPELPVDAVIGQRGLLVLDRASGQRGRQDLLPPKIDLGKISLVTSTGGPRRDLILCLSAGWSFVLVHVACCIKSIAPMQLLAGGRRLLKRRSTVQRRLSRSQRIGLSSRGKIATALLQTGDRVASTDQSLMIETHFLDG